MARPIYSRRRHCEHEGCTEFDYREYSSYRSMERDTDPRPWLCLRHQDPKQVLALYNPVVTSESFVDDGFWSKRRADGSISHGSGFTFGPGFKAWAEDFPPGTRLIVTASIVLPETEQE
jgi:hypothetical protein